MKKFNPVTNSMRSLSLIDRSGLAKTIESIPGSKALISGRKRISARNHHGRITVRYRGGGHKKRLRLVDFKRYDKLTSSTDKLMSEVKAVEYDPNRSAFIALVVSTIANGSEICSYVIAHNEVKIGDHLTCSYSSVGVDMNDGNCLPLSEIRVGLRVHNIELKHGSGGVIARSAGSYAEIVSKDAGYILLRLSSGESRLVPENCFATIGVVSNIERKNEKLAKAGRKRWKGRMPHVRGVAMNPIDHPHGGGEGKTSGGRHPVTPWGKPTKGKKTRCKNLNSEKFIKSRKKK